MRPLTPSFVCYDTSVCAGFFTLISCIDPKVRGWCSHLQMRKGPQRKGRACREPGTEGGGAGGGPLHSSTHHPTRVFSVCLAQGPRSV